MHFFDIRIACRILNRELDGMSHVEDTGADWSISVF